jgi:hypothetical protein
MGRNLLEVVTKEDQVWYPLAMVFCAVFLWFFVVICLTISLWLLAWFLCADGLAERKEGCFARS